MSRLKVVDPARSAGPPRLLALGGVVGPVAFVGAWSVLGATIEGYSAVRDPISELAALGAPSRGAMTAGFIGFGVGLPLYALRLRQAVRGPAWIAASVAGLGALGVAATPLDPPSSSALHGALATTSYGALAALPLLAGRQMAARAGWRWAPFSVVTGLLSAGLLLASSSGTTPGLFQRLGLSVGDVWIVASALHLLRRP